MKKSIRILLLTIIAVPLAVAALSCSEEADCSANARPMLQCHLYTINPIDDSVEDDTLELLRVTAFGTDSVIINNQEEVTDISLPLRYTADSTVLVFRYDEHTTDTLVLRHTNTPYFLSMDCGYQMQQKLSAVRYTTHRLDSIYINNPEASAYATENLKLFY